MFGLRGSASQAQSNLRVTENSLENARYLVKLDDNGDVSSIYDKEARNELLQDARLASNSSTINPLSGLHGKSSGMSSASRPPHA